MAPGRRITIGALLAIAVIALAAATTWFVAVPSWRPALREGEAYGIDVASHQGPIDWQAVARDDIDFAYLKATEGADFTDRLFRSNWRDARAAGLHRGAYHFFTLCSPGAAQARQFLRVAPPDAAALAPAVDLELAGNCSARPSTSEVRDQLRAFTAAVERAWGRPVVFYVGDDWDRAYPTRATAHRPLWHRRILLRPDVEGWTIWQVHGRAKVDGIDGPVDLNVMRPS